MRNLCGFVLCWVVGGWWVGKLGTEKGVQLVYLAVSVMDMSRMNAELAARLKWFPSPSQ